MNKKFKKNRVNKWNYFLITQWAAGLLHETSETKVRFSPLTSTSLSHTQWSACPYSPI